MKPTVFWLCVACVVSACSFRSETRVVPAPVAIAPPPPPPVVYVPAPEPPRVEYVQPDTVSPSRDEYGFRYDAKGNRINRYGHIISPHTTSRD